ncbi:hypothetical protein [Agromyces marinus]|nr:hypothetical protein [Agromyces marinus]
MKKSMPDAVDGALDLLATAASEVEAGWVPRDWVRTDPSGDIPMRMDAENVHFRQVGVFSEFAVEADTGMELRVALDLPAVIHGVDVEGDVLELTINSFRPIDISRDGERVFLDELPTVASGPALITVLDAIEVGANGTLTLKVLETPVPLGGEWGRTGLTVQFTTPRLRTRWRELDLAHARLLLAREFASSDEERARIAAVAGRIVECLDLSRGPDLEVELREAIAELDWLTSRLEDYRIHCIGHSHIDLAWLWTYEDTREVIFRDMESVLGLFDEYPEFRFTHSQARGYAEVEASRPDLFARLRERIDEGRLEPATVQWVEADSNIPSGESQARQLIEGLNYSRDSLGIRPDVLLAPDTFGHAGNIPQLAVQAGAKVYYHHRANPGFVGEGSRDPWQAYWWVGADGTRILAIGTPVYLGPVTASRLARDLISLGKANGVSEICYFYGVGDHGGGPTRADLDAIRSLDAAWGFPAVGCSTLGEYASALLASEPSLPEFTGESERVFEGCYTTHADSKRMNREAESALVVAETLAALAGQDASSSLSDSWRATLHHQFHDIIGGSAVAGAFADQARDTAAALDVAARVSGAALRVLAGELGPGAVSVTNPLGHTRDEVVLVPAELRGTNRGVADAGERRCRHRSPGGGVGVPRELRRLRDPSVHARPRAT